jgi:hypothetical protein
MAMFSLVQAQRASESIDGGNYGGLWAANATNSIGQNLTDFLQHVTRFLKELAVESSVHRKP